MDADSVPCDESHRSAGDPRPHHPTPSPLPRPLRQMSASVCGKEFPAPSRVVTGMWWNSDRTLLSRKRGETSLCFWQRTTSAKISESPDTGCEPAPLRCQPIAAGHKSNKITDMFG